MNQFTIYDLREFANTCIHVTKSLDGGENLRVCGNYVDNSVNYVCPLHIHANVDKKYGQKPICSYYSKKVVTLLKLLVNDSLNDWLDYNATDHDFRANEYNEREIMYYQSLLEDYQWALHKYETRPPY